MERQKWIVRNFITYSTNVLETLSGDERNQYFNAVQSYDPIRKQLLDGLVEQRKEREFTRRDSDVVEFEKFYFEANKAGAFYTFIGGILLGWLSWKASTWTEYQTYPVGAALGVAILIACAGLLAKPFKYLKDQFPRDKWCNFICSLLLAVICVEKKRGYSTEIESDILMRNLGAGDIENANTTDQNERNSSILSNTEIVNEICETDQFGNTSLHLATKRGHPEIVEILIRNGADRGLLNAYNKTPEQMIPENYRKTHPEKIERFKRIEMIYEKYRKKKFRHRVPNDFPLSSYHIYIDDRADDKVTDNFTLKFQSITTDEITPTTTHFIVRTEKDGIFATDSLEILLWIMSGLIIVKDTWMSACLKDEKQISNEWDYLVEKIRYQGVVYDTVPQWQKSMAKWSIPYLCGVYVAVVITEYPNLLALASIVTTHGGVMCESFPEKQNFNQGFRPCLHADTGPFFLIHDGKLDLDIYKNDPDGMYTLMTEAEFVHFMLGRKIKRNKNPNPIPALNDLED